MIVALPLVLLLSLPEANDQKPLLIVVEASAGEVVEASALRDAIAAELGMRVLSPAEEEPAEGVAMMTVAIAPERAVVAFRRGGVTIRRDIQLPRDGRNRLQLVTWLAGNVVRDQTADLLRDRAVDAPAEKPPERTSDEASEGSPEQPADVPPPPPPPPTPMVPPVPVVQPTPAPTVATSALPRTAVGRKEWTVAALMGRGFLDPDRITCNCGNSWFGDEGGQSELEVTRSGPSFAMGGTLIKTRGNAWGLTLGWYRRPRPWLALEVGATAGLWYIRDLGGDYTNDLFIRVSAGLAFSPTSWLDVVGRLSVISPMSSEKYIMYVSAGLRYRLPL